MKHMLSISSYTALSLTAALSGCYMDTDVPVRGADEGEDVALYLSSSFDGPSLQNVTVIDEGTPISGLSGSFQNFQDFLVVVPPGVSELDIRLSGGTGDADLYVRRGALPALDRFDCVSAINGNDEHCSIDNPATDVYFISLFGFNNYADVTLEVTFLRLLSRGVPVTGLSGDAGSVTEFLFEVPNGSSKVTFQISGGTGDVDLYVTRDDGVRKGAINQIGNNEAIADVGVAPGTVYIVELEGFFNYSDVTLVANYL